MTSEASISANTDATFATTISKPFHIYASLHMYSSNIGNSAAAGTLCSTLTKPMEGRMPNPAKPVFIYHSIATLWTNDFYFIHTYSLSYLLNWVAMC
jgi:hypothetical protein